MAFTTILFLALAIVFWGSGAIFDKLSLRHFSATDAFFVRMAVMVVLLLVPLSLRWNLTCAALTAGKTGVFWVGASAFVTMAGVYFYLIAMSGAEASKIVPLSSTYPLVTFLLAVVFLGEGFAWNRLLGTFFVSVGVYFLAH
ncbi:MAG: EamA family transporter [Elusimicrobia bacterium]|nr:EamA family transporter [Elusimicrobiota bacterium]